ncbi:uncharacterized protein LOC117178049 [Belonocnema kinseyi]|uniref:uncharacterized protein LOC117178049 n=1 Tax=Belonocnema kinseyi TaxID=2817044 RepID=UPI00143D6815|nr:uncharacterized protein LOC117178049 [Belonocnema kinseyi]
MGALSDLKNFALLAVLGLFFQTAQSISCYRCESTNSSNPFQCNEFMRDDVDLTPQSCDDVFDAQYCVKRVGRFEGLALKCYQCASATQWECGDGNLVVEALQPQSCDHVFEAQYCIKSFGTYGGGIGTKRECSSKHLGTYCDYVKQPGDKLTYRTCIYTCSGDGCNPASKSLPNTIFFLFSSIFLTFVSSFRR